MVPTGRSYVIQELLLRANLNTSPARLLSISHRHRVPDIFHENYQQVVDPYLRIVAGSLELFDIPLLREIVVTATLLVSNRMRFLQRISLPVLQALAVTCQEGSICSKNFFHLWNVTAVPAIHGRTRSPESLVQSIHRMERPNEGDPDQFCDTCAQVFSTFVLSSEMIEMEGVILETEADRVYELQNFFNDDLDDDGMDPNM